MPLPAAAAFWMGPAALAAAKAMAFEYLPAMSSATLGYLLVRLAWQRCVPEWIRKDISFQRNGTINFAGGSEEEKKNDDSFVYQQQQDNNNNNNTDNELERMSSVIEKIQALMASAQENIHGRSTTRNSNVVVPHIYASILAYIQLSAQLKRISSCEQSQQQQQQQQKQQRTSDATKERSSSRRRPACHHHFLLYQSAGPSIFDNDEEEEEKSDDREEETSTSSEISMLQTAMEYAIAAYYVDDPEHLLELLNQNKKKDSSNALELLQHSINTRPGSVGHFLAICKATKTCWIGCKGTSSLEDVFTDSCGRSVSYDPYYDLNSVETESYSRVEVTRSQHQVVCRNNSQAEEMIATTTSFSENIEVICRDHDEIHVVDHGQDDVDVHIRCHEGILIAAKRLLTKVLDLVVELVVQGDYKLVLTGHSLGAGAVCLLAMLLKSRYPCLVQDGGGTRDGGGGGGIDGGSDCNMTNSRRKMQVYAFASPPVLDHDAAVAARGYMTCVVHHADLIPRSSLANVAVLLEFLRTVSQRLVELDRAPWSSAAGSGTVQSTIAFLRMLSQGSNGEPILSMEKVEEAMQAARDKVELRHIDHLYVPGRVLLIYDAEKNETGDNTTTSMSSSAPSITVEKTDDVNVTQKHINASTATETAALKDEENASSNTSNGSNSKSEEQEPCLACDDDDDTEGNAHDETTVLLDAVTALEDAATAMVTTGPFCVVTEGTTPALRSFQVDGFRMLGDHTSGSYMAAINALAQKEQTLRQLYLQHQTQRDQLLQLEQQQQETKVIDVEEGRQWQTMASTTIPQLPRNEISNNTNSSDMPRQENDETCYSSMASLPITNPATTTTTTTTATRDATSSMPALPLCGSV